MAGFSDYGRFDAIGLAELVRTRQATSADVIEAAIERIEALNPKLNAVVHKMYDEDASGSPRGFQPARSPAFPIS